MVVSNTGIACLTDIAISPDDDFSVLELLDEQQPKFFLSIVTRATQVMTPAKKQLLDILHDTVYSSPIGKENE